MTPLELSPTQPAIRTAWRECLLAAGLAVLVFFPQLGDRNLWTSGEARVTQAARQMVWGKGAMRFGSGKGDFDDRLSGYIVPMLGTDLRLQKPPLAYWMVAACSLPAGDVTPFTARLPSALAGVLLAVLLCLWGREIIGGWGGLIAAAALVTASGVWWQARNSTIEMTLLLFTAFALYAWWRYDRSSGPDGVPKRRWLMLAYLGAALATLDKGPVTPPLILLIILVYLLVSKRNPFHCRWKDHLCGVGVFALITLPWVLLINHYMQTADGDGGLLKVWVHEADRVKGHDHIKANYTYFMQRVAGDGQPWVFFAVIGLFATLFGTRQDKTAAEQPAHRAGRRFAVVWTLVALVYFSIPNSKKGYYILPIYPALGLLAAYTLDGLRSGAWRGLRPGRMARGLVIFSGRLLVVCGLTLPFVMGPLFSKFKHLAKYESLMPLAMLGAGVIILVGWMLALRAKERAWSAVTIWLTLGAVLGFNVYTLMLPQINDHKGDRRVCASAVPHLRDTDRVCIYAFGGQPIYRYYLNRHAQRVGGPQALLHELQAATPARRLVMAVQEKDWVSKADMYYMAGRDEEGFALAVNFASGSDLVHLHHDGHRAGEPWQLIMEVRKPKRGGKMTGYVSFVSPPDPRLAATKFSESFLKDGGRQMILLRELLLPLAEDAAFGDIFWVVADGLPPLPDADLVPTRTLDAKADTP